MTTENEVHRPEGFKPVPRRASKLNTKRLATIRRRIEHLESRIADYDKDGDPAWDREELAALKWAAELTQEWIDADPLFDYDWTGTKFTDNAQLGDVVGLLGTLAVHRDRGDVEIVGVHFMPDGSDGRPVIRLTLRPVDQGDTSRPVRVKTPVPVVG